MPRDMTGTGRYPPVPKNQPVAFYGAVRLGDPEHLARVMHADPYFWTQDNGAGAPLHFATTYRQLDMIHHLLNNGAEINQRDDKGLTALHRAAYLAQYDGYLEIYEYLLSRGADPTITSNNFEPYLSPGYKLPVEVAIEDESIRNKLKLLENLYAQTPKAKEPHPDIGCWWTLYDYGLETVKAWGKEHKQAYPEEVRRARLLEEKKARKAARKASKNNQLAAAVQHVDRQPHADQKSQDSSTSAAPDTHVAFVFPGQGSQAVGMLKASKDLPKVKNMLERAEAVLGYDILQLCLEGPREKLDDTAFSQPALYIAGLAAAEMLQHDDPDAFQSCSATAGLSLGEYCALVFAGVLTFEEGLKIVKVRAESMAAAAMSGRPHGMLSIVGLEDCTIETLCREALEGCPAGTVCQLANYLFPQGRVVSGHKEALQQVQRMAVAEGALKVAPLAVSGAFHTPLMQTAQDNLKQVLSQVTFRTPRIPVISNVTGLPLDKADEISQHLARQLVEPVQWEATLKHLTGPMGKSQLYELGPGQQIKAMCRRIDTDVAKNVRNVAP